MVRAELPQPGQPVTILFESRETAPCATQSHSARRVVFPFWSSVANRTRETAPFAGVSALYSTYGLKSAPEGTPEGALFETHIDSLMLPSGFWILIDYLTLMLAILLLIGAVLQILRVRFAAPLVFVAVVSLWLYYIPSIWDEITGTMWFTMKLGRTTGISWQMLTYQIMAMLCSGMLTYLRVRQTTENKRPLP